VAARLQIRLLRRVGRDGKFLGSLAMPKYPRQKGRPVELPVYGDADHNLGIWCAIGVLVVNWGSDESVFLGMLQALLGGDKETAIIAWLSFHNTANRLELVRHLTKQHVTDKALRADIESAVVEFGGCTKTRNFFCHAAYGGDDEARLRVAHSISLSDDGEQLIRETARRLADLNPVLWDLVRRIEGSLQVPPAKWQTALQRNRTSKDRPADTQWRRAGDHGAQSSAFDSDHGLPQRHSFLVHKVDVYDARFWLFEACPNV
jgi:hypothetical protein